MAEQLMADFPVIIRPVHEAFRRKKIVCPEQNCYKKMLFFEENGLGHLRSIHKKEGNAKVLAKARLKTQELYGRETLQYISAISEWKSKVSDGKYFDVGSGEVWLKIFARDAEEAAKQFGIYLQCAGRLKSYAEESKPCKIEVRSMEFEARFNTWFTYKSTERNTQGTAIILECCFIKKHLTSAPAPVQDFTIPTVLESSDNPSISTEVADDHTLRVLKSIFHHSSFRGKQREAINVILEGKNCLLVLPTGAGKTVCYAIPALISGGVTVVVCPLLSLMLDQVNRLRAKGLNVCYINFEVPSAERDVLIHNLLLDNPPYNFIFLTPENATTSQMKEIFSKMEEKNTLNYIVIDECHCIDMWGYDFRPAYANLGNLSKFKCPVVAMTGTCTARTEEVILKSLNLTDATVVRQSCDRDNISLFVKMKKSDGKDQVAALILEEYSSQCGIVYCLQRGDTTDMAYLLQTKGVNATYYHGALDPYKKKENFQAWQEGRATVMCATVAFGMGIDKPDVRFVIHLSMPKSLECYAQEFGRAGRDGEPSQCFVFFRFEDRTKHLQMLSSLPEGEHKCLKLAELNEMVKLCIKPECRKLQLKNYFGDTDCNLCQTCDFCVDGARVEKTEAHLEAVEVLSCLQSMHHLHPKTTFNLLVLAYRGSKRKEILAKSFHNIPQYGKGKNKFSDSSLQHFVQMLISENVIVEKLRGTNENGSTPYLVPGSQAEALANGELSIYRYKM